MDLTVLIVTHGSDWWRDLALERAEPSARDQAHTIVHHEPGPINIAHARNIAATKATSEWLCFLDADDQLAPGYVQAMGKAHGDLRAPALAQVRNGQVGDPVSLAEREIEELNPCVIGTLIRRERFNQLGGFRNWRAWEDWDLFLRAVRAGDQIEHVPDAVYRAWVRSGSRNRSVVNPKRLHAQIKSDV